jgi:hypothetical protein
VGVTTTGVGGRVVTVGSAATPPVCVDTGAAGVSTVGGTPLAGSLQPVAISASTRINTPVKMIFLFMDASLLPNGDIPMMIFYIILQIAHCLFSSIWVAINKPMSGVINPDRCITLERAVMLADSTANA